MSSKLIPLIKKLNQPMIPVSTEIPLHLHPIDGIETVLFDVYGTLLISGSGDLGVAVATNDSNAMIQALLSSGYNINHKRIGELGPMLMKKEIELWHQTAKKKGIKFPEVEISKIWKNLLTRFQSLKICKPKKNQTISRLAVEYECRINPTWPMPDVLETFEFLKIRGLRLGIISNAQFYTPLILEALLGNPIDSLGFDLALCVWSYQSLYAKPSTKLFQPLKSQIDLSKTLYVGNDMLNDIWAATQVGCKTVLFAGDQRSLRLRTQDARCKNLVPTAVVDNLYQITEMI